MLRYFLVNRTFPRLILKFWLNCVFYKGNHVNIVQNVLRKSWVLLSVCDNCYRVCDSALTTLHLITEDTSFIISMVLFVLSCQCSEARVQLISYKKTRFIFLLFDFSSRKKCKTNYLGGSWDWSEVWKEIGPPSRGFLTIVNDWKY